VASGDLGKLVTVNNTVETYIRIPASLGSNGQIIDVAQLGTGKPVIYGPTGVQVRSLSGRRIKGQYGRARAQRIAADEWQLYGDLETAPFSPLDLSPQLWLDAAALSTITESSGAVSEWRDRSGNGRNVTQATGASQPALITSSLNSLPVVRFDGSADFMDSGSFTITGQQYRLIVVRTSASAVIPIVGSTTGGQEALIFAAAGSSPANRFSMYRDTTNLQSTTTSSVADTAYILSGNFNSTSSSLRVNGVQVASGTVGTNNTGAVRLGRNPATLYTAGDIAEVVIVSGSLTAGQIGDWEAYAAAKWGITI
jgi:hypothetical protein